jgi:hypothetical protein
VSITEVDSLLFDIHIFIEIRAKWSLLTRKEIMGMEMEREYLKYESACTDTNQALALQDVALSASKQVASKFCSRQVSYFEHSYLWRGGAIPFRGELVSHCGEAGGWGDE